MSQDVEKGLTGIELSQLPQNGCTKSPLHQAVKNSDLTTVYELAQTEDINKKDNDGNTALHTAIKRGDIYIIQVLLISPINVAINATNKEGQTPLHLALDISGRQIISVLLSREDIDLDGAKYNGKSCRNILKEKRIVMYMFYMLYQGKTREFIELAQNNASLLEDDDGYRTFLQYACYKGLTDIVEALLDFNVNPIGKSHVPPLTIDEKMAESYIMVRLLNLYVNPIRKSQASPMKIAATDTCPLEILQMLLMNHFISRKTGHTALHVAVKLHPDLVDLTENDQFSIIERLCDHTMIEKNGIDKEEQTPSDLARAEDNKDILIRKFRYEDVENFNWGVTLNRHQSSREKLEQKYPKIVLFHYIYRRKTEEFISLAKKIDRDVLEEEMFYSTLLQLACRKGSTTIVKILLDKGVDPNGNSSNDLDSPLYIAIKKGFHEILQILLENPSLDEISPHSLSWLGHIKPGDWDEGIQCAKLLFYRIDRDIFNIKDVVYENGTEILNLFQYSTDADDSFILEWLKLHPFIGGINEKGNHTFTFLKPLILEKYLDECICIQSRKYRSKFIKEIKFNYKSFALPENLNNSTGRLFHKTQSTLETCLFLKMGSLPEFRQLLKHPVIASFLNLKWFVMRKFFYINVIFYLIFCILLTVYVSSKYVSGSSIDSSQNSNATQSSSNFNATISTSNVTKSFKSDSKYAIQSPIFNATNSTPNMTESFKSDPAYVIMLHGVTVLFWVIFSSREVVQLCFSPLRYVKSLENWIEMSIILTGGFVLFQTSSVDYRVLTLVTLLSWGEAVLLIGRHPKLSLYITIFKTVTWNFLAFLLFYGILILAFALGFCFLFSRESTENRVNPFENPLVAFFRIFIMMTGEFNASEFLFEESPLFGRIIFIIFVFLIAIVLLSLLNGLAVGDIQTIRSDAELLEIMYRIEMFQYYESMPVLNMLSNMFDSLTKLRWLNNWTRGKCNTLKSWFSVALFPDVIQDYKSYIYPHYYNVISFRSENRTFLKKLKRSRFKRFFMWKIDSDIVKAAERINEKKIQNKKKITTEDVFRRCSEQLKLHESKFQTIEEMLEKNLSVVFNVARITRSNERIAKSNKVKVDELLRTAASIRIRVCNLVRVRVPCSKKTFSSRSVRPANC